MPFVQRRIAQMNKISTSPPVSQSLLEAIVVAAYIQEVRR
jgi:hypothetical protein